ncbi:MAG TPA: hypothetical protein VHR45_25845 [Thermoanaerobaculia bacterium]|nr:hypothetical protein [Thermoanaerobaculia bacterium]
MDHSFWIGSLGALLYEASRWIGLRFERKLPAYIYRLHYWLLTFLFIALGGVLSHFLEPTTNFQGLCIGLSAPSILSRLERIAPRTLEMTAMRGEQQDNSFRGWLRS